MIFYQRTCGINAAPTQWEGIMTASQGPLLATTAAYNPSKGELSFALNRDPRTGSHIPDVLLARGMRAGHQLYDIEPRLNEVLWYVLVASMGAFYAYFTDRGKTLVLGIAPPDEHNTYGLISSGNYLSQVLHGLLDEGPAQDYEVWFSKLNDRDDPEYIGFNPAMERAGGLLTEELVRVFNAVMQAPELHMGPRT